MHEPPPRRAANQIGVTHRYFRDIETRSRVDLRKVGAAQVCSRSVNRSFVCGICRRRRSRAAVASGRPRSAGILRSCGESELGRSCAQRRISKPPLSSMCCMPVIGWPLIPLERHRCTHGDVSGARAAGKAGRRGRCAGAGKPQRRRRRTADAPDVEAAEARGRAKIPPACTGSTTPIGCSGSTLIVDKTSK